MPFLTLEDPNAKIKGSRDPLGIQPIWSKFARHVVTNVTSAASSPRGFSILLLARYYAGRLIESGAVPIEEALNVFLRMEQVGAYARHAGHGVEGDIRGIERVQKFLEENDRRPWISVDRRGLILSDQRVYGLWGLYSVSARVSGLIPEGPFGVTPAVAAFLEENYAPVLRAHEPRLMELLAKGGRLDARGKEPMFRAVASLLPPGFTPAEQAFYGRHLRDGLEVTGRGDRERQQLVASLLMDSENLENPVAREDLVELRDGARGRDDGLVHHLERILQLEALAAPAAALFDHVLARTGQKPEAIAEELHERWSEGAPYLSNEAFGELIGEISLASSAEVAHEIARTAEAMASRRWADVVRSLLEWNRLVMGQRKGAPWVRLENGALSVRYRGAESLLPESEELPTLWRNSYFLDSLKNITRELARAA